MSSGDSDTDSGPDSPGPLINASSSSSGNTQNNDGHQSINSTQEIKNSNLGNVVYPAALGNIPQDVLLGLVQTGHLQFHTDEGKIL